MLMVKLSFLSFLSFFLISEVTLVNSPTTTPTTANSEISENVEPTSTFELLPHRWKTVKKKTGKVTRWLLDNRGNK